MKQLGGLLVLGLCTGVAVWLLTGTHGRTAHPALPSQVGDVASDSLSVSVVHHPRTAPGAPSDDNDDADGEAVIVAQLMETMYAELAAAVTASAPDCEQMANALQGVIDDRAYELKEGLRRAQQQPDQGDQVSDAVRSATEQRIGSFYAVLKPHLAVCPTQLMPVLKGLTAIEHEK